MGNSQTSTGKKAVLIGINYAGTEAELHGCVNDVRHMYECLVDHYGFSKDDIKVLVDDTRDDRLTMPTEMPTGKNIREAIRNLVSSAKPHDILFIHFSGHGCRDPILGQCIVPSDFNLIYNKEIREFMNQVPEDCILTMVSDSCHSGGLIQGVKEQIGDSTEPRNVHRKLEALKETRANGIRIKFRYLPFPVLIEILKKKTGRDDISNENFCQGLYLEFREQTSLIVRNHVRGIPQQHSTYGEVRAILLSACQTYEYASDYVLEANLKDSYGLFSMVMLTILKEFNWKVSNRELVMKVREMIISEGCSKQHPGLYCADRYVDSPFLHDGK